MQELLSLANHLADESGKIIRQHFRTPFDVETKSDASPVTVADKGAEAKIREILEEKRPDDGILGEEYGPRESKNGLTWVLDPIDGTKSFVIGRPTFGTLIALCQDGVPILGIIDQPILNERWVGDGKQTTFNGKVVRTRPCPYMKAARVASTAPAQLVGNTPPSIPPLAGGGVEDENIPPASGGIRGGSLHLWQRLDQECAYTIWGGDCYSYGLLANGGLDAVIETMLAPYDYLALVPVVHGAGGMMCNWEGNPLTLSNHEKTGRTLAVGNPALKDQFLEIINS